MNTTHTTCCIVGAGPAGAILALLLVRQGIDVTLIEAQKDFNRAFRGDTVHSGTMELLDQIGLAEDLLKIPHSKLHNGVIEGPAFDAPFEIIDFSAIRSNYPYVTMMPQSEFLNYVIHQAQQYANFTLLLKTSAQGLIEENGHVHGVTYRQGKEQGEIRATVTIAADGRSSKLRAASGLTYKTLSAPMDVLWMSIPKVAGETVQAKGLAGRIGLGRIALLFERETEWQIAVVILKGAYREVKREGLPEFKAILYKMVPEFNTTFDALTEWRQIVPLSVELGRLTNWSRPGLLIIGDAAHTMSPVGGIGINYAIQDAVATANVLTEPLQKGTLTPQHLAQVQAQRERSVKIAQRFQATAQQQIIGRFLTTDVARPPLPARLIQRVPPIKRLLANFVAYGAFPVQLNEALRR